MIGVLALLVGVGALIVNWKTLVAQLEKKNAKRKRVAGRHLADQIVC